MDWLHSRHFVDLSKLEKNREQWWLNMDISRLSPKWNAATAVILLLWRNVCCASISLSAKCICMFIPIHENKQPRAPLMKTLIQSKRRGPVSSVSDLGGIIYGIWQDLNIICIKGFMWDWIALITKNNEKGSFTSVSTWQRAWPGLCLLALTESILTGNITVWYGKKTRPKKTTRPWMHNLNTQ